jgi:hypothetical protein
MCMNPTPSINGDVRAYDQVGRRTPFARALQAIEQLDV